MSREGAREQPATAAPAQLTSVGTEGKEQSTNFTAWICSMPPSELRKANPPNTCLPMRLMLTENAHPAARSTRSILK